MKPSKSDACRRKRKHSTKAYAEAHRRELIENGAFAPLLRVYRCKVGGQAHWHVGHPNGAAQSR